MSQAFGQVPPGPVSYYLPTPITPMSAQVTLRATEAATEETTTPEALTQLNVNETSKEVAEFGVDFLEFEGSGSLDREEERKGNESIVPSTVPEVTEGSFKGETGPSVVAEVETTTLRQNGKPEEDYLYKFNSCSDELKNTLQYLKVKIIYLNLKLLVRL